MKTADFTHYRYNMVSVQKRKHSTLFVALRSFISLEQSRVTLRQPGVWNSHYVIARDKHEITQQSNDCFAGKGFIFIVNKTTASRHVTLNQDKKGMIEL